MTGRSHPRLRFPIEPHDDESVPGVIARAVRSHVLYRVLPVFRAAEVSLRHSGMTQISSSDEIRRISEVVRCDPDTLTGRLGVRVEHQASSATDVRFGTLVMPRAHLELRTRRIGPRALLSSDHHRMDWLNLLLPYCPQSLETLVDRCPDCDVTQGWHYAEGIGSCDMCAVPIPPSPEPLLDEALVEDYRLFAALASLRQDQRTAAISRLPPMMDAAAPGTLIRLAIQIGGLAQSDPIVTASRHAVAELPAPLLASVVATGAAHLRNWPHGLREWVRTTSEVLEHDQEAIDVFRTRLKRLSDRKRESPEFVAIVTKALPDLDRHKAHAFSRKERYYLYREVQRTLGLVATQVESLRTWPDLMFLHRTTGSKTMGQFDADQIDSLVPFFRQTISVSSVASTLGLPIYAVEQLCEADLLVWERHPAVLLCKSQPEIRLSSLTDFTQRIAERGRAARPPCGTVPLARATKRVGGRPKPWAAIFRAIARKDLDCWIPEGPVTARTIHVMPVDLTAFDLLLAETGEADMPCADRMSQFDTAELLNHPADRLAGILGGQPLGFERTGHALTAAKADVLAIARDVVFLTELGWHVEGSQKAVEKQMDRLGVPRRGDGWCRRSLIHRGLVPMVEPFG